MNRIERFRQYFEQFTKLAMMRSEISQFNAERALVDVGLYLSKEQLQYLRTELSHYRLGEYTPNEFGKFLSNVKREITDELVELENAKLYKW